MLRFTGRFAETVLGEKLLQGSPQLLIRLVLYVDAGRNANGRPLAHGSKLFRG